ncbi:hypothetical protein ACHWQZ_G018687 [Mnemiopsis leidyi]
MKFLIAFTCLIIAAAALELAVLDDNLEGGLQFIDFNELQKWVQKCIELKKAVLCSGLPIPLPIPPQFMIAVQIAKGILCML